MNVFAATSKLAIAKTAIKAEDIPPEAAVGAAPLVGTIGQRKIVTNPWKGGKTSKTWSKFEKSLKPGDVMLTTVKGMRNPWKAVQSPLSGTPFYHAELYTGRGRSAGALEGAARTARSTSMAYGMEGYNTVALRLKKSTPKQREAISRAGKSIAERKGRTYSYGQAIKAWSKDVFVPKRRSLTRKTKGVPHCVGPICSTTVSRPYHRVLGMSIAGKKPADVLPSDFLRDPRFKVVGRRMRGKGGRQLIDKLIARRGASTVARLGLGVGMAAAAVGLGKLLRGSKEKK